MDWPGGCRREPADEGPAGRPPPARAAWVPSALAASAPRAWVALERRVRQAQTAWPAAPGLNRPPQGWRRLPSRPEVPAIPQRLVWPGPPDAGASRAAEEAAPVPAPARLRTGSVRLGSARGGSARGSSARGGSARGGSARLGSGRGGSGRGSARRTRRLRPRCFGTRRGNRRWLGRRGGHREHRATDRAACPDAGLRDLGGVDAIDGGAIRARDVHVMILRPAPWRSVRSALPR